MEEDLIFKKASLVLGGKVKVPEGYEFPVRISHSTAGPGAGSDSVVVAFGDMRVKKGISYDEGEFELVIGDKLSLHRNGKPFIEDIEFRPVVYHCPEQAFFTLDPRCTYNCAFCASPRLPYSDYKGLTDADIADRSEKAYREGKIKAVSLTSGVCGGDVQAEVDRFVSCVKEIRKHMADIPIGLEPYAETEEQILAMKDAGADEIKLNVQAATPAIFRKVCPDLDRERIFGCLEHAVKYFGRGKVTSNIIFGLGESDEELGECMERLCVMGVIPSARPLHYNAYNRESLDGAIGAVEPVTPQRMEKIAKMHKEILDRHGLDTRTCVTMCLECRCCDLVPHRDL